MEALIKDTLLKHLASKNLLSKLQHGFLKQHSTGTQLLECLNDWSDAYEYGECVCLFY